MPSGVGLNRSLNDGIVVEWVSAKMFAGLQAIANTTK
jgi:hypothetical protein